MVKKQGTPQKAGLLWWIS